MALGCGTYALGCGTYVPLLMYILVDHPPPEYTQKLAWVRGNHNATKLSPAPQSTHTVRPVSPLNLPAQHRHGSELARETPTWISTQTQLRSIGDTSYIWTSYLCTQSPRSWMKKKGTYISIISPAGQLVQEQTVPPPRPRPPETQLPTLLNVPPGQGRSGHWKK